MAEPLDNEIVIEIDYALPSLNDWMRMHYTARRRIRNGLAWRVRAAYGPVKHDPIDKCWIVVERHGAKELDWVNLYGSFKCLEDVLVVPTRRNPSGVGIIQDDSPNHVLALTVTPVKCKRKDEKTVVRIFRAEAE